MSKESLDPINPRNHEHVECRNLHLISGSHEQVKYRNVHLVSGSHEQVKYKNVHLVSGKPRTN